MGEFVRPRVVGFNHVALEVGVIDEALAFYGRLFRFELRGKSDSMAFIDLGDQFIALQKAARRRWSTFRSRCRRQGGGLQSTRGCWCYSTGWSVP
jgi:catechol 2,3-dioxygenase-like lactoylglutathione lyase family enzyme